MDYSETILETAKYGAFVAFIAVLLYFITSRRERSGFHLFPASSREASHYWFRTLVLAVLCGMLTSHSTTIGGVMLAFSTLLLFGSSFAFWQSDRGFCIAGLIVSAIAILWALLFPQLSAARSA